MMQRNPYDQFDAPSVPSGMPAGSVMIAPPPAADVYDAPQAAAMLNKTNQQIGFDAAAEQRAQADAIRRQQEFVAGLYAKCLRMGPYGQPEPIPGWVDPTNAAEGTGKADLATVRAEAIDKIRLARTLQQRSREGWFTTGAGANIARLIGGSPAYDVRQDTETLENAGAVTRIMEMAKANGGKNPLTPLSNSDFQALSSSLSNLETGQSDDQFQTNVQRVIDMYSRAYQGAGGTDLEGELDPTRKQANPQPVGEQFHALTVNNVADFAAGLNGGKYQFSDKGLLTYNGQPVDAADDVVNSAQYREAYHRRFGEWPVMQVSVTGGQTGPETPSVLEQRRDTVSGGIDAAIRGAADTATLGIADPLTAAVQSAFNDDGFAANLTRERAISSADEEVNPYWRLGGQLAGVVPTMTGLARGGAALTPARPFLGTAIADTVGGGVYGGVSNAETDPVTGALIGGGAALVGNQVGQRLLAPGVARLLARGQEVSPVARALASSTTPEQITGSRAIIAEALRLKLPMAMADADPKLRTLAGSATRLSPVARETAERILEPRGRAQAERAVAAIERDFGPSSNMIEARAGFKQAARNDSRAHYEQAFSRPAPVDPDIDAMLQTPAGKDALNLAARIAQNEGRDPRALGFDLNDLGEVIAVQKPSFETLHMVKRGLDGVVEGKRGATGVLNREDPSIAAIDNLRARFRTRLGDLDENYRAGNAAYAGQMRNRDALDFGYGAVRPGVNPDTVSDALTRLPSDAMKQGYRSGMVDQVESMRLTGKPYDAVYGTPDQIAKVGTLFPEGAENFARQTELERLMAKTQYETLGGSPTAGRQAADRQLAPALGVQLAGETALGLATGVPPIGAITSAARATVGDRLRLGLNGSGRAASIAELLLNPVPQEALATADQIILQQLARSRANSIAGSAGAAATLPLLGAE